MSTDPGKIVVVTEGETDSVELSWDLTYNCWSLTITFPPNAIVLILPT